MTALAASVDPDLAQAIEDLRPVAAELFAAQRQQRAALGGTLKHAASFSSHIGDLKGRIRLRAERIGVSANGLFWYFRIEERLRAAGGGRRLPSKAQLGKRLQAEATDARNEVQAARAARDRAQKLLDLREWNSNAAAAAVSIFEALP